MLPHPADATAPLPDTECANCGARVADRYCGSCGQQRVTRLGFGDLASTALAELASLDTAFLRTFVGLSIRPGRVARDYIDGHRARYLNPLKYALLAVTVYVVLAHLFGAQVGPERRRVDDGGQFELVVSLLPYLMIVALLPAAALQSLLSRSSGDRVAECYVFGLYAYSHVCWILTPLVLLGIYGIPYGFFVVHGLRLGFWIWATAGFYGSFSIKVIARSIFVFLVFFFSTLVLAVVANALIRWWNA